MKVSSMVQFDKNWELENGKVCFNTIGLTSMVGHMTPVSLLCYIKVQMYLPWSYEKFSHKLTME